MKLKREGTPKQDMNMKKLFRRNQIIITTLAIMIAAAGYLNYAGKRELEASTGDGIYQAGTFDISEEDLLTENQKNGAGDTALIEEAQPQAEGSELQAEATQGGTLWRKQMPEQSLLRLTAGMAVRRPAWKIRGRQCSPAAFTVSIT